MNNIPDDAELTRQANRYALDHCVSFNEAVRALVASFDAQSDSALSHGLDETDRATHVEATRYAAKHGVSYMEAVRRVVAPGVAQAEADRAQFASTSDRDLHVEASRNATDHGVSYSEALRQVAPTFSTPVADAQTDSFGEAAHGFISFREPPSLYGLLSFGEQDAEAKAILEGQMVEIFKAGRHVSTDGQSIGFTPRDVADIARGYRPSIREAPLVEGHPASNEPAKGWVEHLEATPDGRLLMKAKQVDPSFAESVKAGRFKKRSACFYPPNHPSNPMPGQWYLCHVGWLGAHQPAVAGLKDVNFKEQAA